MARSVPPGRVREVARAACRVFIEKGYRRTLMADVARVAELSAGSMYTYVASKEALFHLALLYAFEPEASGGLDALELPFPTPLPGETIGLIEKWATELIAFPTLARALSRRTTPDPAAELGAIVDERYDVISRSRRALALLEQSAIDLPEVFDHYYRHGRRGQVDSLARYLERRADAGLLRAVPDAATSARFVIEAVAWFAWHRKGDPDSTVISDAQAKATVHDMLLAALLP